MKSLPILFYHNIGNNDYRSFSTIEEFEYQMSYMHKHQFKGVDCDNLDKDKANFGITFDDGYEDNLINALPILKKYNFTATCFVVPNLIGKTNSWDIKQFKLMDKKQIQDWLDAGMNIGSHSLNHTNLTKISNNDVIIEIENSKKILEDMFGVKINNFCYPFGKFNKFTANVVEERGYLRAFTTNRGLYKTPNFEIKRVPITKGISKFKFWLKTRTIYENI